MTHTSNSPTEADVVKQRAEYEVRTMSMGAVRGLATKEAIRLASILGFKGTGSWNHKECTQFLIQKQEQLRKAAEPKIRRTRTKKQPAAAE